ncbi:hypothetical protein PI124_g9943 [Phytophthora idaei]|nr:hypothetical protein PI124_g9943 [Phytophthora idaei]
MSHLSSTTKAPISTESSSSGVRIKRKSRRHRTVTPATNYLEELKRDFEGPRGHSRRVRRDATKVVDISAGEVKRSNKRRSNIVTANCEGGNSRPTGAPSLVALATKCRSEEPSVVQESTIAARRSLTSSASSIRPSNRKRLEVNQAGETLNLFGERQRDRGNNNEPEYIHNEIQPIPTRKGSDSVPLPGQDWLANTNNNHAAARITLSSRASKYRNLSAGVNKKPRARVPVTNELPDRPPSRQRHAFPTHLIDANAFDSPETTARCGRGYSSTSSTSSARSRGSPIEIPYPPESVTERPPSSYMVKAKRCSKQGLTQDLNESSRRGVVDKSVGFPAHHDPKNDGFADVDESVPPPFRIEVTTDGSETTLDSPDTRSTLASGLNTSRKAQPWPFSNQGQLLRMAVRGSDGSFGSNQTLSADLDAAQSQLQWFGKDDQINNAHLFETIISLPSPRPTLEPDLDIAIEDDLEDSDGPQTHSRNVVDNQRQPQQEPQQQGENRFTSRRAAAVSKMATPKTTVCVTDDPELQWIRSSTNPFFVDSSLTVDYDSMDPETAIEQTPLYTSEDLMTLAATEMTDLRLDDYTALADASMPAPPPSTSGMEWEARLLPASRSPLLRTSLGKDFLSLFAQH